MIRESVFPEVSQTQEGRAGDKKGGREDTFVMASVRVGFGVFAF